MSENQYVLAEAAARLFAGESTRDVIEASEIATFPRQLWTQLHDLGFLSLLNDVDHGGIGADFEDACAVMRAAGYFAAPGPIAETIVANWMISLIDKMPVDIAGLLVGRGAAGAWLREARRVVLVENDTIRMLEQDYATERVAGPFGEPVDRLIEPEFTSVYEASEAGDKARGAMALLRSAQMIGAMEWCLQQSISYVQTRSQFGKPLARLQIVQQYLAEVAGELVSADAVMTAAARGGPGADVLVAGLRSRCANAADVVFAHCHQVHGAIGFSREYPLNFRTRRIMAWRDDGDPPSFWRERIGRAVLTSPLDPWAALLHLTT